MTTAVFGVNCQHFTGRHSYICHDRCCTRRLYRATLMCDDNPVESQYVAVITLSVGEISVLLQAFGRFAGYHDDNKATTFKVLLHTPAIGNEARKLVDFINKHYNDYR